MSLGRGFGPHQRAHRNPRCQRPAFSFIFDVPPKEVLEEAKRRGIVTLGTATTPDEAIVLEQVGVDIVMAFGFEAGGHRGSFLMAPEDSLTGTFSLAPQTGDAVKVPVVAAGGIADARGIAAAYALGAEGIPAHREAILSRSAGHTPLTRGFSGRLARGINNDLPQTLNRPDFEILPYPLQRSLIHRPALPAQKTGRSDLLAFRAVQSANLVGCPGIQELLLSLVEGGRSDSTVSNRWIIGRSNIS